MVKPYLALIALALCACATQEIDTSAPRPNIVIVYTDDQGWQDVGVYGAVDFSTPNLDRLAVWVGANLRKPANAQSARYY